MGFLERLLLTVALVEIPLQLDTYLFYQEADAAFGSIGGLNLSVSTFCLLGLYGLWLVDSALRPSMAPRRWVGNPPLVAYVALVAFSALVADSPPLALFVFAMLVQAFALYFYIANRPGSAADVKAVVAALAVCLATHSVLVLATKYVVGNRSFGPVTLAMGEDGRPGGSMISPVLAGSVLALLVPPVAALGLGPVGRWQRLALLGAATLGVLAVMVTQTRGAILSLMISGATLGLVHWRRGWLPKWAPLAVAGVGLLALGPLIHVVTSRVAAGDEGSAGARIHLTQIALETIERSPVLGYGAGNCHRAIAEAANSGPFREEWFYAIHCKYLLEWIETGVFGLLAFVGFLLTALRQGWRGWRQGDRLLSPLALACAAAILGQMVHMAVDVFNSRSQVQTLWACAGLAACVGRVLAPAAGAAPAGPCAVARPQPLRAHAC